MKWNKLTIETTTAAEDMLSYELSEMGMEEVFGVYKHGVDKKLSKTDLDALVEYVNSL